MLIIAIPPKPPFLKLQNRGFIVHQIWISVTVHLLLGVRMSYNFYKHIYILIIHTPKKYGLLSTSALLSDWRPSSYKIEQQFETAAQAPSMFS